MLWAITSALIIVSFFAFLAWMLVNSPRPWHRLFGVGTFLVSVPSVLVCLSLMMGSPVPYIISSFPTGKVQIIGAWANPRDGILLLISQGMEKPVYYALPWSPKLAQKIENAERREDGSFEATFKEKGEMGDGEGTSQASATGLSKKLLKRFEFSWQAEIPDMILPEPQSKVLPDKPDQPDTGIVIPNPEYKGD